MFSLEAKVICISAEEPMESIKFSESSLIGALKVLPCI